MISMSLDMQLCDHLLIFCIFFLFYARLLFSNSKEVPVYGFPCKPVFVSKGLFRIFHTLVSLFLNTSVSEKKSSTSQLILPHEYEEVKLSVLLMSARIEMLAQWNRQKMRTGEMVKAPVLVAVPVYAALKLSKYSLRRELCKNLQQNI